MFLILIWYCKSNYFDNKAIPGLRPQLFYGNLLQTGIISNKHSVASVLSTFQQTYSDIFQFYYYSNRIVIFNTVEHVQEIYRNRHLLDRFESFYENAKIVLPKCMLSIKNEEWKRHARIIEPLLKRTALIQYFDRILNCTDQLIEIWRKESDKKKVHTEVINQCQQLLMEIMSSISYGEKDGKHLTNAITECNTCSSWSIFNGLYVTLIKLYINYCQPNYNRARQRIRNLINTAQANSNEPNTLLQSLLRSPLSSDEVLNEMLMINTGVEGVSTTLSWFIYYMSKYPRVQEKIKLELRQYSTLPPNELVDQLHYIDLVIKEILRHSPVADLSMRTLVARDNNNIELNGISFRPGDAIGVAISNLHHDQRYWKIDPSLFYPERFLENDQDHPMSAYLPFGIGHYRSCPGKYFALYELKVICVRLMQMITFSEADSQINTDSVSMKGGFVGLTNLAVHIKCGSEDNELNSI